jgi:hypothetical protein
LTAPLAGSSINSRQVSVIGIGTTERPKQSARWAMNQKRGQNQAIMPDLCPRT